jgi:hypothetical protein
MSKIRSGGPCPLDRHRDSTRTSSIPHHRAARIIAVPSPYHHAN